MNETLVSGLSLVLNQRQLACVLDPTLALSSYGLSLVKQLSELVELWIVREFWHILENPQFYLSQPGHLLGDSSVTVSPKEQQVQFQQVVRSLQEWERLRLQVDPNTRKINFLADVLGESCVPVGADEGLIWRWESLAQSLDSCIGEQLTRSENITLAYRDLAALAAARPACILTHRSATELAQKQPPHLCTTLTQWGIPCQEIDAHNPMANLERDYFRNLLVRAGVSKLLWAGLQLVVLHLVVPIAATVGNSRDWSDPFGFSEMNQSDPIPDNLSHLWDGAQGFWYPI